MKKILRVTLLCHESVDDGSLSWVVYLYLKNRRKTELCSKGFNRLDCLVKFEICKKKYFSCWPNPKIKMQAKMLV